MRLKLTLAYDGRPFAGSQSQASGNTIQDLLESAIEVTAKQPVRVHFSGRTDAGVHALEQIAHFDAPASLSMNPYNWVPALNSKLPATIRVMACEEVADDFHARFQSFGKTYQYRLCVLPILPPMLAGVAWHLPKSLDVAVLQEVLDAMCGWHDFRWFAAIRGNEKEDTDFFRYLWQAQVQATDDGYVLEWSGTGFFYKMVRLMTGAAVHVAQGKMLIADLLTQLNHPAPSFRETCPHCAPADGLTLLRVHYQPPLGVVIPPRC